MAIIAQQPVTVMSYDMDTRDDDNVNTEIKDILKNNYEWHDNVPEQIVYENRAERIVRNTTMTETTLWKQTTPAGAKNDFKDSIIAYNSRHLGDRPARNAHGKMVAFCNNEYEAYDDVRL